MTYAPAIAVVLVTACAAVVAPAHAHADDGKPDKVDAKDEARRLAARAQVHYDLGEYGLAIADYREAYRIHPSPGLLYNLAQAYRLSGDCVSATTMYRNYLRLAPKSRHRNVARQHLSALAECHRLNTGWDIVEEGTVNASHRTGGKRDGRVASLDFDPLAGEPVDEGEERPGHDRKVAGLAVAGGGAALAMAGVYFSVRASSTADEVSRLYDEGAQWEQIESLDQRGRREELAGAAFLIAGGAALATGATLYALGWRDDRRASVSVAPTVKGAAVSVSWGF